MTPRRCHSRWHIWRLGTGLPGRKRIRSCRQCEVQSALSLRLHWLYNTYTLHESGFLLAGQRGYFTP
ncbi:hypothetical protein BDZ91DRAFT_728122 [Kalaharituber pfeilii]|nr:hypothetical protein BDZ91DRAFT_728122 [Kalaharituber pfeilii]